MVSSQKEGIYVGDLIKYVCRHSAGLRIKEAYEPVPSSLGVLIDMTNFYNLSDLDFHSRLQGYKKASSSCVIILL